MKIGIGKFNKYKIRIIITLMLLIYTPAIPNIKINVLHIIGFFSWIYIFFNKRSVFTVIRMKKIMFSFMFLLFTFSYILFIVAINGNSLLTEISYVYWLFDIIPASIMITTYMRKLNYNLKDLINILLIVGTFEALTSALAFLFPPVQNYFLNTLMNYGYSDNLIWLGKFRAYGFASNLTYTMPIVQAFLAILSVYMGLKYKWIYICYFPFLAFSAIINARTSIVIFIIGIFAMLITLKPKLKNIRNTIIISLLLVAIFSLVMNITKKNPSLTYAWIQDGVYEISDFIKGDRSAGYYFGYLSDNRRYEIPKDFGLIIGKGTRAYSGNKYNLASDIGYINDIWLGGILYFFSVYIYFGSIIFDIKKYKTSYDISKFLFYFIIGTMIVTNIKGIILSKNDFTTIVFLLYVFVNSSSFKSNNIQIQ